MFDGPMCSGRKMTFLPYLIWVNFCKQEGAQTRIWPENCTFHPRWSKKKALATKSKQKMVKSKKDTVGDFPNFYSLYKTEFCQKKNDVFDYLNWVKFCKQEGAQTRIWPENCTFHLWWSIKKHWQQNPNSLTFHITISNQI